ncbi:MAG: RagB/SusD family nutrient uptake outer membrane protein, partial [Acidobacteria bacterium]|nr:RagB/SusD family nutrient uptake outer membrane protein [Acidobacteriota bacterium]NIQ30589.1 RagB/SusD family nutrient uptake outer membrane protein [Acidobacteriota bacterium]
FNRALKARVAVYQQDWTAAEQALNASFIDDGAPLSLGVYHAFGTGSGDDANELLDPGSSPDILAHPSIVTDADTRANNEIDLRVQSKVRTVPGQTVRGIT